LYRGDRKIRLIITLLLALFISGQAYAQSASEILGEGKIIYTEKEKDYDDSYTFIVVYKDRIYNCVVYHTSLCRVVGS
jgi:hypothetical protein